MRRHLSTYFKALPHFKDMRLKLVTLTEPNEILILLDEIYEKYKNYDIEDIKPSYFKR